MSDLVKQIHELIERSDKTVDSLEDRIKDLESQVERHKKEKYLLMEEKRFYKEALQDIKQLTGHLASLSHIYSTAQNGLTAGGQARDGVVDVEPNTLSSLMGKIQQWAILRGLHEAEPEKQMLKLVEEVGELAQGLAKSDDSQVADSIGDVFVVLTVLSLQLKLDLGACVEFAYDEIKDRKGKMVNGVYVKEEDLK